MAVDGARTTWYDFLLADRQPREHEQAHNNNNNPSTDMAAGRFSDVRADLACRVGWNSDGLPSHSVIVDRNACSDLVRNCAPKAEPAWPRRFSPSSAGRTSNGGLFTSTPGSCGRNIDWPPLPDTNYLANTALAWPTTSGYLGTGFQKSANTDERCAEVDAEEAQGMRRKKGKLALLRRSLVFVVQALLVLGCAQFGFTGAIRALRRKDDLNATLALLSTVGPCYLIAIHFYTKCRSLRRWSSLTIRVHIYTHIFLSFFALFAAACTALICAMLELNELDSSDYWEASFWLLHAFGWETAAWLTLRRGVLRLSAAKVRVCRVESCCREDGEEDLEDTRSVQLTNTTSMCEEEEEEYEEEPEDERVLCQEALDDGTHRQEAESDSDDDQEENRHGLNTFAERTNRSNESATNGQEENEH